MPKKFQHKTKFEITREVAFKRQNRKLFNLLETNQKEKFEEALQPIRVWEET
jgi:hypothetical protein